MTTARDPSPTGLELEQPPTARQDAKRRRVTDVGEHHPPPPATARAYKDLLAARAKKTGFSWYRDVLNAPKHICAPMVDQSELAFRLLCLDYNTHLCYTPMLNSKMILSSIDQELADDLRNLSTVDSEGKFEELVAGNKAYQHVAEHWDPVVDLDRDGLGVGTDGDRRDGVCKFLEREFQTSPLEHNRVIAQFCGDNPNTVLAAARLIEPFVAGVDLNCGCPQGIAKKGHYGAYLLEEPDVIASVCGRLARDLKHVPVTCKIRKVNNRAGYQDTVNLVEQLVNGNGGGTIGNNNSSWGISALTIHGRTKEEKGQHVKEADWEIARILKQRFGQKIPIFCNGGIENYSDVLRCFEETGCDAVMSSEGLLEDPQLFMPYGVGAGVGVEPLLTRIGGKRKPQDVIFEEYVTKYAMRIDNHKPKCVKAHCFHMLYAGLQSFPDLRAKVGQAKSMEDMLEAVCGPASSPTSSSHSCASSSCSLRARREAHERERAAKEAAAGGGRCEEAAASAEGGDADDVDAHAHRSADEAVIGAHQQLDTCAEFPNLGWYRRYRNPIGGKQKLDKAAILGNA